MIENLEFLKNIVDDKVLKQYENLKDCEFFLQDYKKDYHKNPQIEGSKLIVYSALSSMLKVIQNWQKNTNKFNWILVYDKLIYKIQRLFMIVDKDDEFEKALKIQKFEKEIEKDCLIELENLLMNITMQQQFDGLSTIYLYFEGLSILQEKIDKYIDHQITKVSNKSNNIYAAFNDDLDIDQLIIDIEKVKTLIFAYKNNKK